MISRAFRPRTRPFKVIAAATIAVFLPSSVSFWNFTPPYYSQRLKG